MSSRLVIIAIIVIGVVFIIFRMPNIAIKSKEPPLSAKPTNADTLKSDKNTDLSIEEVTYFQNVKGFYARPKAGEEYPGVIMVHEWWGLNDQIKQTAQELAKEGYQVLAVDLYKGNVAKTPQEAQAQIGKVNQAESIQNMQSAVKFLQDKHIKKIAVLGWCFGGGQALQLSLSGVDLQGTVIYYGTPLITDQEKLANVKWPVLGIFGDKDQAISVDQVNQFADSLNTLHIKNEVHIYPGVGHAFANPTGQSYAPNETKDAWTKTLNFFNQYLKNS